jgi:carbon-monoxide dehydrogenase small subunit
MEVAAVNSKQEISLKVNGESWTVAVPVNATLLWALREEINLTGAKEGCDDGSCGACTVTINGRPALACLTLAVSCQGAEVMTIEGLSRNGSLHALQKAFIERDAVQCGFCIPGMLVGAKDLLDHEPDPTPAQVRERLSGHICRCTGYVKMIEAVLDCASPK